MLDRRELAGHYDPQIKMFTRSFRIGPVGDCCAASAGLAMGLSFATFATARADARDPARPWKVARNRSRAQHESVQRSHLRAYIRDEKAAMEGPKGGSDPIDKTRTPYMSIAKRWEEYKRSRRTSSLPVIGSESLFGKLWKKSNIVEEKAVGHAKCNRCSDLQAEEDKYVERRDDEGKRQLERVRMLKAIHKKEHRTERDYSEDFWHKGEKFPDRVTAFNQHGRPYGETV